MSTQRKQQLYGELPRPLATTELLLWSTSTYLYLFVVLRLGSIDYAVARFFASPGQRGFPLRHGYLTEFVLHDLAQGAMKLMVIAVLLVWLLSWLYRRLVPVRRAAGYLLLTALLSVGLVNLGKQLTNVDCPWDLQIFGGTRGFYDLFDSKPDGAPVGHCFPGGHSSTGFALLGLFFVVRRRSPAHTYLGLLPALLLGGLFSVDQWARGAHFPSHDLTTAYLCWITAVLGDAWLLKPPA